jgi:hypothetical protein
MSFYVKKLGLNELGNSTGKGSGQRGRFILISPTKSKDFFPGHSIQSKEKQQITIPVIGEDENQITYAQYNWHPNKKHGGSTGHAGSDHRFYINSDIFSKDYFRLGDYAVFYKFKYEENGASDYYYKIFRFSLMNREYNELETLTKKNHSTRNTYHGFFEKLDFIKTSSIKIEKFIFSKTTKQKYKNPESLCTSSDEFRTLVRGTYKNQCAIMGAKGSINTPNYKKKMQYTNLEAAHLWPDSWKGPLRPDNGILMEGGLHKDFDRGFFTITDDYKVKVHESLKDKDIFKFNEKEIFISESNKPNLKYLRIHQKFIFGNMKPISSNTPGNFLKYLKEKQLLI